MVERIDFSTMGLNIKNVEVEKLAAEVAYLTGESKTEAIRKALAERKERLAIPQRKKSERTIEYLQREVWPFIKPEFRGKAITKEETDALYED